MCTAPGPHQRGFLLKEMVVNAETHSLSKCFCLSAPPQTRLHREAQGPSWKRDLTDHQCFDKSQWSGRTSME